MKKQIILNTQTVEYDLRIIKRSRRVCLSIRHDGSLLVSAPRYIALDVIENFITSKARWIIDRLEHFKNNPGNIYAKGDKHDYLKYKDSALVLAQRRVDQLSSLHGFKFNKISIKNQATRWGSCSRKGNLNFNYKIAILPKRLADYIIVHEFCHLKEFNHSKKFWNLVSEIVPDFAALRSELKRGNITFT
ncbi:MAG: SprT family zinc-dependent metalloprotease [Candidatus Falkowbacteria bacterium]|nr:SprT family zinc-dependent metalloprotease [Candidatus Falkowbacteria bacterium]